MTEYFKPGQYPYILGRGILRVKKESDESWKDLFHIKEFKINVTADELEHENFRSGVKRVDRTAIQKQKATFSFVTDVLAKETVLLWVMGDTAESDSQVSGSWTAQAFTVETPGEWQELGKREITITAITDDAGTPVPLVEGTDYYIDLKRGLFLPLPGSTLVGQANDGFKITGTYAEHIKYKIQGGKTPALKRHLWFAGDPAEGLIVDIKGYGLLRPSGDLGLIADEWAAITFEGSFMEHVDYGPLGFQEEELGTVEA